MAVHKLEKLWAAAELGAKSPTGLCLTAHCSAALAKGIAGQSGASSRDLWCNFRLISTIDKTGSIGGWFDPTDFTSFATS
jgi:hypothetical protein